MVSSANSILQRLYLNPSDAATAISTTVAAKALQVQRQEGAAFVQLLAAAAEPPAPPEDAAPSSPPALTPGDPLVAQATGLGSQLDIRA